MQLVLELVYFYL